MNDDDVNCLTVNLLAYWYCNQFAEVRWQNSVSARLFINNGVRQGDVLSPLLFTRYIRDMISTIVATNVGCANQGQLINLLAYADDLVLIAPSWRAMQRLLSVLDVQISSLDMTCNISKTVCMVFTPTRRDNIVTSVFPLLKIGASSIQFVGKFKYLGHYITSDLIDDEDIHREIKNKFIRANVLFQRVSKCSFNVKIIVLFKSFCLGLYDVALWKVFKAGSLFKFQSCYNRCIKLFFWL